MDVNKRYFVNVISFADYEIFLELLRALEAIPFTHCNEYGQQEWVNMD